MIGRVVLLLGLSLTAVFASAANAQAAGGTVAGWGEDGFGQVSGTPKNNQCECTFTPETVPGISDATQVAGGYFHGVALRANGTVVAWGHNGNGQLGDGTDTDSPTPVQMQGITNAIAVAASYEGSMALLANGTVVAWGANQFGELGQGGTAGPEACGDPCSPTPVPVPGLSGVVAIDGGYQYNLALLADGRVMAWGNDDFGQLGDGIGVREGCECVAHPVPVPGIAGAMSISADWYVGSALLQDGTIRNWGYNFDGELGNGTRTTVSASGCFCLGPVSPIGLTGARETVSGGYHGLALLSSGSASGWGYNEFGEVGSGKFNLSEQTPVAVSGPSGFKALAAGTDHSLALLPNGTAMAWGKNGGFRLAMEPTKIAMCPRRWSASAGQATSRPMTTSPTRSSAPPEP